MDKNKLPKPELTKQQEMEADIHNSLSLGISRDKAKQLREYHMDGQDVFVGGNIGPDGKYRSDLDLMRDTADEKEYKEEWLELDLKDIKKDQVKKNNKDGKFYDGYGVEKPNANANFKVRARLRKAFKKAGVDNEKEIDRIMFSKDWDDYNTRRLNQKRPFESKLDNVIKGKTPGQTEMDEVDKLIRSSQDLEKIITDARKELSTPVPAPQVTPQVNTRQPEGILGIQKVKQLEPPPHINWRKPEAPKSTSTGLNNLMGINDDEKI